MANNVSAISECLVEKYTTGRWFIARDANCDGAFTISDVWLWVDWLFNFPGDGLLWLLIQSPGLAAFFELTPEAYGNWFSTAVSIVCWLVVLLFGAVDR